MMTLPPCNCTICYQMYNNERSPLILTKCGHTFCKECLDIIMNQVLKQISCPECKQITEISDNPGKSLPKNRGLLNLIIYQESLNKNAKRDEVSPIKKPSSEGEKVISEYELAINKIEETYNKIIDEHSYLNDISDVLLRKEVDDSLDNFISIINEYRMELYKKIKNEFEKINLIKSFKGSIEKYKIKLSELYIKYNIINKAFNTSIIEEGRSPLTSSMVTAPEDDLVITETPLCTLTQKDLTDLKGEIEFIELYNLTLKNYSKDIYNPCNFFFVNKFQFEKLTDDLKKLLSKVCDFDESINTYQINKINNHDVKKLIREMQETCTQSNFKKLQCIFSHYKINPNFFYSDSLDCLSSSTTALDFNNPLQGSIGSHTFTSSFNTQLHLTMPGNQRNPANNNVIRNVTGNASRVNPNTVNTNNNNTNNNSTLKEKITSFYSFLKLFKDKGEQVKLTRFLIDEFNYIPLKFDCETRIEVNFVRDIDWKIPLSII